MPACVLYTTVLHFYCTCLYLRLLVGYVLPPRYHHHLLLPYTFTFVLRLHSVLFYHLFTFIPPLRFPYVHRVHGYFTPPPLRYITLRSFLLHLRWFPFVGYHRYVTTFYVHYVGWLRYSSPPTFWFPATHLPFTWLLHYIYVDSLPRLHFTYRLVTHRAHLHFTRSLPFTLIPLFYVCSDSFSTLPFVYGWFTYVTVTTIWLLDFVILIPHSFHSTQFPTYIVDLLLSLLPTPHSFTTFTFCLQLWLFYHVYVCILRSPLPVPTHVILRYFPTGCHVYVPRFVWLRSFLPFLFCRFTVLLRSAPFIFSVQFVHLLRSIFCIF